MSTTIAHCDAIADACAQLAAVGKAVTTRAVREIVGGGSETTILRGIHAWQDARLHRPDVPPPPEALATSADALVTKVWTEAWAALAPRLESANRDAERAQAEAQRRADEAMELNARLEADLEHERAGAAAASERERQLEIALARSEEARTRLESAVSELGRCRQELDQAHARERDGQAAAALAEGQLKAVSMQLQSMGERWQGERAGLLERITDLERREAVASEAAKRLGLVEAELAARRSELEFLRRAAASLPDAAALPAAGVDTSSMEPSTKSGDPTDRVRPMRARRPTPASPAGS
jgi:hypothetical protein